PATGEDDATGLYLHIEQAIAAAADALGTELGALEGRIDDLAVEDIAGLAGELSSLEEAIAALNALTGEDGAIDDRLTELEGQIDALEAALAGQADTTAPTVVDVQLVSASGADANGHLNAGDVVSATVRFSEAVLVSGEPKLALKIGDNADTSIVEATLTAGGGTDTLTFSYTITEEDFDANGIGVDEDG